MLPNVSTIKVLQLGGWAMD